MYAHENIRTDKGTQALKYTYIYMYLDLQLIYSGSIYRNAFRPR